MSSRYGPWSTAGVSAASAVVSYLVWLGWHALAETSAYAEWQVAGLAVTWAAVVVVGAARGSAAGAGLGAVAGLVAVWCADAATTPRDDASLWPIGAAYLLLGSATAAVVLAGSTAAVGRARARRA